MSVATETLERSDEDRGYNRGAEDADAGQKKKSACPVFWVWCPPVLGMVAHGVYPNSTTELPRRDQTQKLRVRFCDRNGPHKRRHQRILKRASLLCKLTDPMSTCTI